MLGLGGIAYTLLLLGLLHLLWIVPVGIALLLLAALAARPGLALIRETARAAWARRGRPQGGWLQALPAVGVALLLGLALAAALAPPTFDWDGLSYHLADPKIYLRHRGILPLFWESHSNFPFTVEMLYTLALLLKSPGGARAFHWLFLLLTCGLLAGAWRRVWPDAPASARWLAPLLLCSAPIVLWTGTLAYIDLGLMAYEALALYGVWEWARGGRGGWLWVGAISLGLALGTKMTALAQAALLAPAVLGVSLRAKQGLGPALRRVGACAGIAAAVASPWYLKSFLYTRNPVYPFFYNLFPHTRWWNAECAKDYAATQNAFGMGHAWHYLLAAPWDLLAHADRFTDPPGFPSFAIGFGAIGAALLALAPVVLLLRRRDAAAGAMLLYTAAFAVLWFKMSEQTRYLMPVLPLLALVGARAYTGLVTEERMARLFAAGAIVAQVAVALAVGWRLAGPALPVVTGQVAPSDYLREKLRALYVVSDYANTVLPEDARLMLISEPRGFYLDRDYLWGDWGHHACIPWPQFRDEREMRAFVRRELGVTHVLLFRPGLSGPPSGAGWDRTLWDAIRAGTLKPVYNVSDRSGTYALFSVEEAAAGGGKS